jgi:dihydroxyacetone kinase-like protein
MTMDRQIDAPAVADWVREFARTIITNKDALSELDSTGGDADHGANLERGMTAVLGMLDNSTVPAEPGALLKQVGMTIVSKVGGSSGALYGTIFLRMALSAGNAATLDKAALAKAFRAGLNGIVERGQVKAGDKTMYGPISPSRA